jgi:large conductance mechanosensitive channel
MGFVKEFREFALKGNVMDLAVGVIIGGAFGIIVNSMVKDIIMPIVGIAGKADFSNLYIALNDKARDHIAAKTTVAANGVSSPPSLDVAREGGPVLAYGNFITVVINFIILAFCIFLMVKLMNKLKRQPEAAPAVPPPPSKEEVLLAEIRDAIRAQR